MTSQLLDGENDIDEENMFGVNDIENSVKKQLQSELKLFKRSSSSSLMGKETKEANGLKASGSAINSNQSQISASKINSTDMVYIFYRF